MKYIYGPVYSWRLGRSLGVDLLSQNDKICNFDCEYCQVGKTPYYTVERKVYVPTKDIIEELKSFENVNVDYITFSGKGEPTLAKNLGEAISEVKKIRKNPTAVLTNSTLLYRSDVVRELCLADNVSCKIDASSDKIFYIVNKQDGGIKIRSVIDGIKSFRMFFKGKLSLQVMFVKNNIMDAPKIADIAKSIGADEVQLNTPTRHMAISAVSQMEMGKIKQYFSGLNVVTVYDKPLKKDNPVNMQDTQARRGT